MTNLKTGLAALLPRAEGNALALLQLARLMRKDGRKAEALDLCQKALALAPQDGRLQAKARAFISADVPQWHFSIIVDALRNNAYDTALRRAITPQSRVLDIGTGSGLLAMMAARAGAREVFACEMHPTLARIAEANIARNGYAGRIKVIAKHSDALDIDTDLGGPVDIIVSEIVSNNLLGENVLPAHERAIANCLRPGGKVIPARGTIRVALAEKMGGKRAFKDEVAGFDLTALLGLRSHTQMIPVGDEKLQLRSEVQNLFTFDFGQSRYTPPGEAQVQCLSAGGIVNGVAQWFVLNLDEATQYEHHPQPGTTSCWGVLLYPFAQSRPIKAGDAITVYGSHDRHSLYIWTDADGQTQTGPLANKIRQE